LKTANPALAIGAASCAPLLENDSAGAASAPVVSDLPSTGIWCWDEDFTIGVGVVEGGNDVVANHSRDRWGGVYQTQGKKGEGCKCEHSEFSKDVVNLR